MKEQLKLTNISEIAIKKLIDGIPLEKLIKMKFDEEEEETFLEDRMKLQEYFKLIEEARNMI